MSLLLNIESTSKQKKYTIIEISGDINEISDFTVFDTSTFEQDLFIKCSNIKKINSTGVKKWISFFTKLKTAGHNLYFQSMSPLLVDQRNQVMDFLAHGEIISIQVPFQCKNKFCKKEFYIDTSTDSLTKVVDFENNEFNGSPACPHCGHTHTEFSDFVEEYFHFLKSNTKTSKAA